MCWYFKFNSLIHLEIILAFWFAGFWRSFSSSYTCCLVDISSSSMWIDSLVILIYLIYFIEFSIYIDFPSSCLHTPQKYQFPKLRLNSCTKQSDFVSASGMKVEPSACISVGSKLPWLCCEWRCLIVGGEGTLPFRGQPLDPRLACISSLACTPCTRCTRAMRTACFPEVQSGFRAWSFELCMWILTDLMRIEIVGTLNHPALEAMRLHSAPWVHRLRERNVTAGQGGTVVTIQCLRERNAVPRSVVSQRGCRLGSRGSRRRLLKHSSVPGLFRAVFLPWWWGQNRWVQGSLVRLIVALAFGLIVTWCKFFFF